LLGDIMKHDKLEEIKNLMSECSCLDLFLILLLLVSCKGDDENV